MKKRKYQSHPLMVAHMMMEDMYELGFVTDEEMRECDEDCLVPEPEPSPRAAKPRKKAVAAKTVVAAPKAPAYAGAKAYTLPPRLKK